MKESKEKIVKFDQQGCHFIPHALIVRTDQTVAILSGDPILHNTDVVAVRNSGQNSDDFNGPRRHHPMEISTGGKDADHGQMRHPSLDAGLVADR